MSYNKVGDVLVAQGKLDEALKAYRDSLAISRAPGRRRSQQYRLAARSVGVLQTRSATCWWRRASSPRRSKAYRDSLAIAERLAAADRSNTGWQRDLSVSYDKIGDVLVAQGKLDEALKSLPRQPRHSRAPGRRRSQQHRVAARSVGVVQQDRRRAGGAGQARRGAQGLPRRPRHRRAPGRRRPRNAGWQRDLSVSYDRIGDVLVAQGELDGGAQELPRRPRHRRAPGRGRSQQRRLAARSLGVATTRSATCWWRRASSTRRSRATATASPSPSAWPQSDRSKRGWQRDLSVSLQQDRRRAGGAGQARRGAQELPR